MYKKRKAYKKSYKKAEDKIESTVENLIGKQYNYRKNNKLM